jgi:hypothetical protein
MCWICGQDWGDYLGCLDVLDMWPGLGRLSGMLRCAVYVARIGETIWDA